MIFLHVYTEEESAEKVFSAVLPQMFPDVNIKIYKHQGKHDLENGLRKTLPSISKDPDSRILITRDQNSGDCHLAKSTIENIATENCTCPFKVRIICRELESWFLGDFQALSMAFPRFNPDQFQNKKSYRKVDILIRPDQHLLKIIPELSGKRFLPKVKTAEKIAPFLEFERNRSISFKNTIQGIQKLIYS